MTANRKRPKARALPGALLAGVCWLAGCQQKMAVQPSYRPDQPSSFFADGRADRPLAAGTVARGHLRTDRALFAGTRSRPFGDATAVAGLIGLAGGGPLSMLAALPGTTQTEEEPVDRFPFPITAEVLEHGQNRYMIYCVVCHDPLGTGRGMIVERGYTPPPSYHIERLRQAPVGHLFEVVTKGYGSMPSYRRQIPPRDRWAIIAYVRALQMSQHFPESNLTEEMRREWSRQE